MAALPLVLRLDRVEVSQPPPRINLAVPAGEFKNPTRDLPLALLTGTLAIAAIYVLVQLGAMSVLPDLSQSDTPIASAAAELIGPAGALAITAGAPMLNLTSPDRNCQRSGSACVARHRTRHLACAERASRQ